MEDGERLAAVAEATATEYAASGADLPDCHPALAQCRAELRRLRGEPEEVAWAEVAEAWLAREKPYPRAYALWRRARALSASGQAQESAAAATRSSVLRTTSGRPGCASAASHCDVRYSATATVRLLQRAAEEGTKHERARCGEDLRGEDRHEHGGGGHRPCQAGDNFGDYRITGYIADLPDARDLPLYPDVEGPLPGGPTVNDGERAATTAVTPDGEVDGWAVPAFRQQPYASCASCAVVSVVQYLAQRMGLEGRYSRRFLYYNARAQYQRYADHRLQGTIPDCTMGTGLRNVLKALNKFGICEEALWP